MTVVRPSGHSGVMNASPRQMNSDEIGLLFERYAERVLQFFVNKVQSPSDANDLAQETFIRVFERLRRGDVRHPRAFLFGVATLVLKEHWKAKGLDFSKLFHDPQMGPEVGIFHSETQIHHIDDILDRELIKLAAPALEDRKPVQIELPINNVNRSDSGTIFIYRGDNNFGGRYDGPIGDTPRLSEPDGAYE